MLYSVLYGAPAGGTTHDLSGSITGTGSASATLSVDRKVTGAVTGTALAAASLGVDRKVSGAVVGSGAASASLAVDRKFTGAMAGSAAATAALGVDRKLTGAVSGAASVAGSLTRDLSLSGSSTGTATVSGSLVVDPGTGEPPPPPPPPPAGGGYRGTPMPPTMYVERRRTEVRRGEVRNLSGHITGRATVQGQLSVDRGFQGEVRAGAFIDGALDVVSPPDPFDDELILALLAA